ncbi:peptide deformylase [Anaplasma phagocytophilum]|uniref:Peptide deformylase n=1 Tax=Anaplasma phagocytophilum (strain HZ) TaxID=212042 RepID=Q2GID0_ANAPZ|nr:peptide deformylase [Anaplasma phagocytophilum]ABD43563.1 peptide deformylase [Anaplasma phagocytophilum str. HZ]AGR79150.1 peptide deformylase [Anaplasma phagocytophilum str. HZ2]
MSVRPLVVLPDSRLFLCSEEVRETDFCEKFNSLVEDMFDTMYAEQGIGLAAVQVGVHKRIFVIDLGPKTEESSEIADDPDGYHSTCGPMVVINPEIVEKSVDLVSMEEGCLSVPDQRELVVRPERIVMQYTDLHGKRKILKAQGLLSRCLQHEIDHLNGTVFLKHISKLKRDLVMQKMRKAASLRKN